MMAIGLVVIDIEPACVGVVDCAMAGVADSAIVRAMAGARISFLVIVSSSRKSLGSFKSRIGSVPMPAFCRSARGPEEHTSELQPLMRTSYAVFCLKKKTQ